MRGDALTIPCPYCRQPVGERCFNEVNGEMVSKYPAHLMRLKGVGY